jgi:CheY-like chemotaxis protein
MDTKSGRTKAVLVIEDDAVSREGLATLLQRDGWTVLRASNGREALNRLKAVRPDLVFLDMLMPVMDGWQFLRELRQAMPAFAVPIVLTTTITIASREWALAQGCAGYLPKPIQVEALFAEIRRLVPK